MGVALLKGTITGGAGSDTIAGPASLGSPVGWFLASSRSLNNTSAGSEICLGVGDGTSRFAVVERDRNGVSPTQSARRAVNDSDYIGVNINNGNVVDRSTVAATAGGLAFTHPNPPNADRKVSALCIFGAVAEVVSFDTPTVKDDFTDVVLSTVGRPDGLILIGAQVGFGAHTVAESANAHVGVGFAAFPTGNTLLGGQYGLNLCSEDNVATSDIENIVSRQYVTYALGGPSLDACEIEVTATGFRAYSRLGFTVHSMAALAWRFTDGTTTSVAERSTRIATGPFTETGFGTNPIAALQLGSNHDDDEWDSLNTAQRASIFSVSMFGDGLPAGGDLVDATSHSIRNRDAQNPSVTERRSTADALVVPRAAGTDGIIATGPVMGTGELSLDWDAVGASARALPTLIFGNLATTGTPGPTAGEGAQHKATGDSAHHSAQGEGDHLDAVGAGAHAAAAGGGAHFSIT